jgi:hypothetical protein
MDPRDAEFVLAMPLETDEHVLAWFELLDTAHSGLTDPAAVDEFAAAVRESASWCDPAAVEGFLRVLSATGEGLDPVARVVAERSELPGAYWALYHQWYSEPAAETGTEAETDRDRFGWLSTDQSEALRQAWGEDWRDHLGPQLDHRWGEGWQAHPAEHRQHWLTDVLTELLTPAEPAAAPEQVASEPVATAEHAFTADKASSAGEVDLDQLAAQAVAETLAELTDVEPMSAEDLAEAVAIVRHNLQEAMNR